MDIKGTKKTVIQITKEARDLLESIKSLENDITNLREDFETMIIPELEGIEVETMSITDLSASMRSLGFRVSEQILGDYILAGKYPFAVGIDRPDGKRNYQISKQLYIDWVLERQKPKLIKGEIS